ncbi:L,D-transpeptidase [Thermomonospora amylolytica]|uniref:L,D-transpeptidase n=1 Tax=Thermomonospora amylolytica TaxID=1411117 RepID=UPI001F3F943A|nr:Ig-like domain-containing protein [Thermomonospora amylolytica]
MNGGVRNPEGRRPARTAGAMAAAATLAAAAAGCSGDDAEPVRPLPIGLSVVPHGATGVPPENPIVVRVHDGTLQNVTVRSGGEQVEGSLSGDRGEWRSRWALTPGAGYEVMATAMGRDGRTRTVTSRFTTRRVTQGIEVSVEAPNPGETVGIGMPIILRFDRPVTDKAAVERALEVRSSRRVEGAWHWFAEDQSVVFRPRRYWPARTNVRLIAHLNGVRAVRDGYATQDLDLRFRIGEAHTSVASARTHRMVVYRNGRKIRDFPISMGKGTLRKYTTTNGVHLTMDKGNPVIMDSSTVGCPPGCPDYYRQTVYWSVRISNSGEYVHAAPWSVGSQGRANVSHGCVNMAPEAARWFYNFSYRGDPYTVTGTDRELEPDNGWGYWQLGWRKWVAGSALGQSVMAGPEGSTPVRPRWQAQRPPASPSPSPSAAIPSATRGG